MIFSSSKAQEIYERIRTFGKINYWIGLAEKNYMTGSALGSLAPQWNYDNFGLREELKRQLESFVNDAEGKDWEEIAKWLFELATLAAATK
jgi:hypothetical protein